MRHIRPLLTLCFVAAVSLAQTTQSLITGTVVSSFDGQPLARAELECTDLAGAFRATAYTGSSGTWVLPLLSPGRYRIRVSASGYQPQELQQLDLAVASFLALDFRLRPARDVWEQGLYRSLLPPGSRAVVTVIGPDIDMSRTARLARRESSQGGLEATLSTVVSGSQLNDLPLAGRDAYSLLVSLPGVTSDAGSARGLGVSVGGQRPSSSSFLLDGVENNNATITGPLVSLPPEALQEYRISTANFSAEYGRTSGFLANAITRPGGPEWHGSVYSYLKNDALNANGFSDKRQATARPPLREVRPGFSAGGPLGPAGTFASGSYEMVRSRSAGPPERVDLPTTAYRLYTAPNSIARRLLDQFPAPLPQSDRLPTASVLLRPPLELDQRIGLARLDQHFRHGADRILGRVMGWQVERPGFIWTPYPDFTSPLRQNTWSVALSGVSALRPNLTLEARAGVSRDDLHWDRPHPEIPTLTTLTGALLPGSPAFYAYRHRSLNREGAANFVWTRGTRVRKAGGGILWRALSGYLTAGRDGRFVFDDFVLFGADWPNTFEAAVRRDGLPGLTSPDYRRNYTNRQYYFYLQESWRVTPRLVLNYGARYENFGAPRQAGGTSDLLVELGSGGSLDERLASARLQPALGASLYSGDNNNLAGRFGLSWQADRSGRTVLRAAYGIFYDRPFDNLWQNLRSNSYVLAAVAQPVSPSRYLAPAAEVLQRPARAALIQGFPELVFYQPGMRDGYVQSWFAGVERQLPGDLSLVVSLPGSAGRKLITTDKLNRPYSSALAAGNPLGRTNPAWPTISYRANQGASAYQALGLLLRRRTDTSLLQASYTWSHALDNQSDPLAGDFFDVSFTRLQAASAALAEAAFSRPHDSRGDRGNSDFDQRHNLALLSSWDLVRGFHGWKRLLSDWRISQWMTLRSGFPFSVFSSASALPGTPFVYNNRADLLAPDLARSDVSVAAGRLLLNPAAFRQPAPGARGNTGRNAFHGPGLFSFDASLSREIKVGESASLTLRADAFNLLNHANLGNPDSQLQSPGFGLATYGRTGRSSGFPASLPLNEQARQIQFLLRVQF